MTVKELIKFLETVSENAEVLAENKIDGEIMSFDSVMDVYVLTRQGNPPTLCPVFYTK